jgi:hypothetical protein
MKVKKYRSQKGRKLLDGMAFFTGFISAISFLIAFISPILIVVLSILEYEFAPVFVILSFIGPFGIVFGLICAFVWELVKKGSFDFLIRTPMYFKVDRTSKLQVTNIYHYKLFRITSFLFSAKTQKDTFEPAVAEWDEEIYEALKKDKDTRLFMINVRNTYGFIKTMILESFVGELFEFIQKIKKG